MNNPEDHSFYPESPEAWRDWLAEHHATSSGVWVIFYKKASGKPSLSWSEAVDEALCFGWIDSKPNKRDEESSYRYFSPRNPKSNWSRVNKEKIAQLTAEGRMAPAGLAMVEEAKRRSTWTALDAVENLEVPPDLQAALGVVPQALEHWEAFPKSTKKAILEWIMNAKRPETRQQRIEETARLAGENIRANQWRQPKGK